MPTPIQFARGNKLNQFQTFYFVMKFKKRQIGWERMRLLLGSVHWKSPHFIWANLTSHTVVIYATPSKFIRAHPNVQNLEIFSVFDENWWKLSNFSIKRPAKKARCVVKHRFKYTSPWNGTPFEYRFGCAVPLIHCIISYFTLKIIYYLKMLLSKPFIFFRNKFNAIFSLFVDQKITKGKLHTACHFGLVFSPRCCVSPQHHMMRFRHHRHKILIRNYYEILNDFCHRLYFNLMVVLESVR